MTSRLGGMKPAILFAVLIVSSGLAHGAISACVTTNQPAPSGFTGGNGQVQGQQLSTLPSATPSSVPASSTGCQSVELNYSNFSVANINTGTVLNPGAVSVCDGNTVTSNCNFTISYSGSPTVTPTMSDVLIEGTGTNGGVTLSDPGTTTPNQPFGGFAVAPNPWLIEGKNAVEASGVTYTLNVDPSAGIGITQLSLTATVFSHSSGGGGSNSVTFLEVCPNTPTFTEGCAGEMLLENGIINGHNFSNTATLTTGVFPAATTFGVRQVIFLTTANGEGSDAGMTNLFFDIPGEVSPEPSTWAMMFGGIAGLGLLHRRRRS